MLCGGNATERDVSIQSGTTVGKVLSASGWDVEVIDTAQIQIHHIDFHEGDFAFLALHGKNGEDGTAQAILQHMGVPYSGASPLSSALAMRKDVAKQLWRSQGLATPAWTTGEHVVDGDRLPDNLNFPVVVKPCADGCSFGLSLVENGSTLSEAISKAGARAADVLIEEFVAGREFTVPFLGEEILHPVEIHSANVLFDHEAKYHSTETSYTLKPALSEPVLSAIELVVTKGIRSLGARVWGRMDVLLRECGEPVLLELNTAPGLTPSSVFLKATEAVGMSAGRTLERIIELSLLEVRS